jgi:hypothetical protein
VNERTLAFSFVLISAASCVLSSQAIVPAQDDIYSNTRSVIDYSLKELTQAYPRLKSTLRFSEDQRELESILQKVGGNTDAIGVRGTCARHPLPACMNSRPGPGVTGITRRPVLPGAGSTCLWSAMGSHGRGLEQKSVDRMDRGSSPVQPPD